MQQFKEKDTMFVMDYYSLLKFMNNHNGDLMKNGDGLNFGGWRPLRLRIGFCGVGVMDSFNETCNNEYGVLLHNCLIYLKAMPLAIVTMSPMLKL
jgi:hypothetical protein